MTSISAFNDMMQQFIDELSQTFPNETGIKKYAASFGIMRKSNARKCIETYMTAISPYATRITAKDETFFEEDIKFLNELNIKTHWTPDLSNNTKDAIWQYLQTLYMLGMTITSIPDEALQMIESVAGNMAQQLGGGGGEGVDEQALMSSVSGLLGNLGNMLGNDMLPTNEKKKNK